MQEIIFLLNLSQNQTQQMRQQQLMSQPRQMHQLQQVSQPPPRVSDNIVFLITDAS